MQPLDQWNSNLTQLQKDKVIHDNFVNLDSYVQATNLNLLASLESLIIQTISSTSYVLYSPFSVSVASNGGVIMVVLSVQANYGGNTLAVQLQMDNQPVKTAFYASSAGAGQNIIINMTWISNVNQGNHLFSLYAKIDTGTATLGSPTSDANLYVTEYAKG